MRVLVIEDDATLGHALQEFLGGQGYAVDWLRSGDRVEGALAGQVYDLLLLDLNLPGLGGLEVLRRLRDGGSQVPVLILTARDGLDDRVAGLDAGADDYVTKPFELPELAARVRALARRRAGQARSGRTRRRPTMQGVWTWCRSVFSFRLICPVRIRSPDKRDRRQWG